MGPGAEELAPAALPRPREAFPAPAPRPRTVDLAAAEEEELLEALFFWMS